jgi:hypothetical protein
MAAGVPVACCRNYLGLRSDNGRSINDRGVAEKLDLGSARSFHRYRFELLVVFASFSMDAINASASGDSVRSCSRMMPA